jgi:DNA polymerase III delta subunit
VLSELLKSIDETITLAIWEEKRLGERHPLVQWFTEHEVRGLAKIHTHQAPSNETVVAASERYLHDAGMRLHPSARTWIREQLLWLEKAARSAKRLKSADELAQDERSWWLYHTLDAAILQAEGNEVGIPELEMGVGEQFLPVSVFECVNALVSGRYDEARKLLHSWQRASDEGAFYGLYALLRRQFGDRRNTFALRLLADIELITKNTQLSHAWLMDMFILRMQQAATEGIHRPIVRPKRLWQGQLPRS